MSLAKTTSSLFLSKKCLNIVEQYNISKHWYQFFFFFLKYFIAGF